MLQDQDLKCHDQERRISVSRTTRLHSTFKSLALWIKPKPNVFQIRFLTKTNYSSSNWLML